METRRRTSGCWIDQFTSEEADSNILHICYIGRVSIYRPTIFRLTDDVGRCEECFSNRRSIITSTVLYVCELFVDRFDDSRFRNSWNAVYVAGAWRFVQCNWGARHLVNAKEASVRSMLKKKPIDQTLGLIMRSSLSVVNWK